VNESQNPNGRFFVGTPRTSDGSLLFLQHMISKWKKRVLELVSFLMDHHFSLGIVVQVNQRSVNGLSKMIGWSVSSNFQIHFSSILVSLLISGLSTTKRNHIVKVKSR